MTSRWPSCCSIAALIRISPRATGGRSTTPSSSATRASPTCWWLPGPRTRDRPVATGPTSSSGPRVPVEAEQIAEDLGVDPWVGSGWAQNLNHLWFLWFLAVADRRVRRLSPSSSNVCRTNSGTPGSAVRADHVGDDPPDAAPPTSHGRAAASRGCSGRTPPPDGSRCGTSWPTTPCSSPSVHSCTAGATGPADNSSRRSDAGG